MNQTREQLQAEFTELRNAQVRKGGCKRTWNIYFDHLLDTDTLARVKTDEELVSAIAKFKAQAA